MNTLLWVVLIFGILIMALFILSKFKFDEKLRCRFPKMSPVKFFVVFCATIGIITSILIPLYQVPDELTHINMIYKERGLNVKFEKQLTHKTGAENIATKSRKTVLINKYFDLSNKITVNNSFAVPKLTIIRHFPQCIGMLIGEVFHFPVFIYITFAEFCALAFYIFICTIALKKMPFKKNLMMCIMLLPVAVQQMGSFSYDVVLNCFCFLFIAYIMELKFIKKYIKLSDIIKLILILVVIAICKIPYAILGLLFFLLPIQKFEVNFFSKKLNVVNIIEKVKKHKVVFVLCAVILLLVFILFGLKILQKMSIGKVLIASLRSPVDTLKLYVRTIQMFFSYYLDTIVGNLGWFDTKFPLFFEVFVYFSLILITFIQSNKQGDDSSNHNCFKRWEKIFIYVIVLILVYVVILSMFLWTLYCTHIANHDFLSIKQYQYYIKIIPYIGGVQGRYFLPIIPLIFLPIDSKRMWNIINKINPITYQAIYYMLLLIVMIIVLLNRYWI